MYSVLTCCTRIESYHSFAGVLEMISVISRRGILDAGQRKYSPSSYRHVTSTPLYLSYQRRLEEVQSFLYPLSIALLKSFQLSSVALVR